jgi:hypothetical protein
MLMRMETMIVEWEGVNQNNTTTKFIITKTMQLLLPLLFPILLFIVLKIYQTYEEFIIESFYKLIAGITVISSLLFIIFILDLLTKH